MVVFFIIFGALFFTIMIPAILMPIFPQYTIFLVEVFLRIERGDLYCEKRTYTTGSGYSRSASVYLRRNAGGPDRIENARVFLWLIAIFGSVCSVAAALTILSIAL